MKHAPLALCMALSWAAAAQDTPRSIFDDNWKSSQPPVITPNLQPQPKPQQTTPTTQSTQQPENIAQPSEVAPPVRFDPPAPDVQASIQKMVREISKRNMRPRGKMRE